MGFMKTQRKPSSINLPVWMDTAVRDLAQKHKRTMSGEIEFLIEEAVKNNMPEAYERRELPAETPQEAAN
jgi:macrodomain Ter protein organizer (MatP/YcbG family)